MTDPDFGQRTPGGGNSRLLGFLNLEPGEGKPSALLSALYFALVGATVFLQTTTYGLFIEAYGTRGLTYAYLLIAVIAGGTAFAYVHVSNRISLEKLVRGNLVFSLLVSIIYWAGLRSAARPTVIFLLPLWLQIFVNIGSLTVWPLAGQAFNLRQAKRAYGVIVVGYWLASSLIGALVAPIVDRTGLTNLLLISAGWIAAAGGLLTLFLRQSSAPESAPRPAAALPREDDAPFKNPYARLIFGSSLFWWIAYYFIDINFYERAGAQLGSSEALAGFLGQLLSATGILALVTTLFFSGRIVSRYGLKAGLMLEPVLVTATFGAVAALSFTDSGSTLEFWLVALAKLFNLALGGSITTTSFTLLYQALPRNQRTRVQTLSEGFFQPAAIGISGISLLLLTTVLGASAQVLALAFLGIAACWLAVTAALIRQYPPALARALVRRQLGSGAPDFSDADSQKVLVNSLDSEDPDVVAYALNTLAATDRDRFLQKFPAWLPGLLKHPSPEVRLSVLDRALRAGLDVASITLPHARVAEHPAERAAALRTFVHSAEPIYHEELLGALRAPETEVRQAAIAALLNAGRHTAKAIAECSRLAASHDTADRLLASDVIREVAVPEAAALLRTLIDDPDPVVRRAALRAAPGFSDPGIWTAVIDTVTQPETGMTAIRILAEGGPHAQRALANVLGDKALSPRQLRLLAAAAGSETIDALKQYMHHTDPAVRSAVLDRLHRLQFRTGQVEVLPPVRQEIRVAQDITHGSLHFDGLQHPLVHAALAEELGDVRRRVLNLIGFTSAEGQLNAARPALLLRTARGQAWAIELLDTHLPASLKPLVLPVFEPLSDQERLDRWAKGGLDTVSASSGQEWAVSVLAGDREFRPGSWTRLCLEEKLNEVSGLPGRIRPEAQEAMLETAAWAMGRELRSLPDGERLPVTARVRLLRESPMFHHIHDPVLAQAGILMEEVHVKAGETIFRKGDAGDSLYVVVDGLVRIHDGSRLINSLGPGEGFGEMALLDPEPRAASAVAAWDALLLRLDREAFNTLLQEAPDFTLGIIRMLTHRLRELGTRKEQD